MRRLLERPSIHVWGELPGARHLAMVGTLVAFLLAIVGLTTPSPTLMGGEGLLREGQAPGIQRITRHPFLWGVAIWAVTHFIAMETPPRWCSSGRWRCCPWPGHPPSTPSAPATTARAGRPTRRAPRTFPFAAILSGRNQLALGEIGWWKLVVGLVVWGALLATHTWLFGVSPFPI